MYLYSIKVFLLSICLCFFVYPGNYVLISNAQMKVGDWATATVLVVVIGVEGSSRRGVLLPIPKGRRELC